MSAKKREDRRSRLFGKLPPLHDFVLNPYPDVRFSTCPGCGGKTRQRKLPLLIYIEPDQFMALNKTCRYCPNCDLLIAHQDEVEALLAAIYSERAPVVVGNDYLVIGTVERKAWRDGVRQPRSPVDMQETVHDFRGYREVHVSPGGWFPEGTSEPS
jgi:hypothetical protein